MLILSLDTTSPHGGAGLYQDFRCLTSSLNQGPSGLYSVSLFQMVDWMLEQEKISLRDIDLFAAASGPGSFTGIRIGLAALQGWATAWGRPVKAVSVFEAMVEEARPVTEGAMPVLDARRGEFFVQAFRRSPGETDSRFFAQSEGLVVSPEKLENLLEGLRSLLSSGSEREITCIVKEHDNAAQTLERRLPTALRWQRVSEPLTAAIARVAFQAYREGNVQSPAELEAFYVRRTDAEILFQKGPAAKRSG